MAGLFLSWLLLFPSRLIKAYLTNGKAPNSQVLLATWTKEEKVKKILWWDPAWCSWILTGGVFIHLPVKFVLFCFCLCWHLCCGCGQSFPSVGGTCLMTNPELASLFLLLVSHQQDKQGAATPRCYLCSAVSNPQDVSLIRQLSLHISISYLEPRE